MPRNLPVTEFVLSGIFAVVLVLSVIMHLPWTVWLIGVLGLVGSLGAVFIFPLARRIPTTPLAVTSVVGALVTVWSVWMLQKQANEPVIFSPALLVYVALPVTVAAFMGLIRRRSV